jgi:hypothetical protein
MASAICRWPSRERRMISVCSICAASGFIGRGYDKVGDGAPLDFRGAFQDTGACRTKARKERAAALW